MKKLLLFTMLLGLNIGISASSASGNDDLQKGIAKARNLMLRELQSFDKASLTLILNNHIIPQLDQVNKEATSAALKNNGVVPQEMTEKKWRIMAEAYYVIALIELIDKNESLQNDIDFLQRNAVTKYSTKAGLRGNY